MSIKPIHTRRSARPVGLRAERRPLQQRLPARPPTSSPLAPTFARAERRRDGGR
jgi:hypothetical protein